MLDQLEGIVLEPTNICTLKCEKCPRTDFINRFPNKWINKQLNLDHLKTFIDIDIKSKLFTVSGTSGDPIYYNNLFELISWIKYNGGVVHIETNGSYKSREWWKKLCSLLDINDAIVFAIDGIPENFTTYRINADWASIKVGIEEAVKTTRAAWKFIPFAFNEDSINEAKKISMELGMHSFYLDPSSRWSGNDDPLKPKFYVDKRFDHVLQWVPKSNVEIDPKCKKNNKEHFILADGFYVPCCVVADHRFYYTSEFYKNKEKYDISKTTLTQVLEKSKEFYATLEEQNLKVCTFTCPKL